MPLTPDHMFYFNKLQTMNLDEFMEAWHDAISSGDNDKIGIAESIAVTRFGPANFRERYAEKYLNQTHYQFPAKR